MSVAVRGVVGALIASRMVPRLDWFPPTAMRYSVPPVARKTTRLVRLPPLLSSAATSVRALSAVPVHTESVVSKPLPAVLTSNNPPPAGAVHFHHDVACV